jgi:cytochrome c oxidase assembly protein subunit 11
VSPGLNWSFSPEQPEVQVKVGQTTTVYYKVRNDGPAATTGIATFNVQPALAGAYFIKLECFCFTEKTLQPGETTESAVVFYVDPALVQDPNVKDLSSITLSYTYFPAKGGKSVNASIPENATKPPSEAETSPRPDGVRTVSEAATPSTKVKTQ